MHLNDMLENITKDHEAQTGFAAAGARAIGKTITSKVNNFTATHNLDGKSGSYQVPSFNDSIRMESLDAIGVDQISDFVNSCGIPKEHELNARKLVAIDIAKNIQANGADIISFQNLSDPMGTEALLSEPSAIFPSSIPDAHAFGSDIDKVSSDLRLSMGVDMMRFHTNLAPRIMHVKPTADAIIRYTKTKAEVFNNQDMNGNTVELVDLYEDASMVNPTLPIVTPLTANGAPAAGYIGLGKSNLFELSLDATKAGYSTYNRQDTIADGAYIDKIMYAVGEDLASTNHFSYLVGKARGRLGFTTNGEASIRTSFFETDIHVNAGTLDTAGVAGTIFATLPAGEGLVLRLSLNVKLNLRTGDIDALASAAFVGSYADAGGAVATATTTLLTALQAAPTFTKVEYFSLTARFSEENLRKSSMEIEAIHSELAYNLPTGVNYFYSEPLMGKSKADRAIELLTAVIGVGQDSKIVGDCIQVMDDVRNAITLTSTTYAHNGAGKDYAAGSIVRPYVYTNSLDAKDFKTLQVSNLPYDVKQYVLTHIGNIIDGIHANSFYTQQLGGKPATYKVVTSGDIISKLFSQPRMVLGNQAERSEVLDGGNAYRLELPTGVIIELHATTQHEYSDMIIGMPYVADPDSELNFGADWTFGVAIAHYVKSGSSTHKRMVANSREAFIPTCPIAFKLNVTNLGAILDAYKP